MADAPIGAMSLGDNQPSQTPASATPLQEQPPVSTEPAYDATRAPAMPTNFGDATSFADAANKADAQPDTAFKQYDSGGSAANLQQTQPASAFKTSASSVVDQMTKLLNPDSELNRVVKANTRSQAASLGMGSSAMAVEAGQTALLKQAESIGSKEAELNSKFELQQQAASNNIHQTLAEAQVAGDLNVQKAAIQEQQDKVKRAWDATMSGLSAENQAYLTDLTKGWDQQITQYQLQVQERMKKAELDANTEVMLMNQSNEMMNNYQVTVQQLMSNTEFLDSLKGPDGKTDRTKLGPILDAMFGTVSSALLFSANAVGAGDRMSPYIQQLITQNKWTAAGTGAA